VVILEKPREAMINQHIPLWISDFPVREYSLARIGVDRVGGSIMHCIVRASYPPYAEWNRDRRVKKVREFRHDLAKNFEGYYMRLDQDREKLGPLYVCKRELEFSEGVFRYEFLDYIGKIINKNVVMLDLSVAGKIQMIPGTRVYGKSAASASSHASLSRTQSPGSSEPPMFIFIIHLGSGAYELVGMVNNVSKESYTLFPENHLLRTLLTNF
jgi:hypothetical protein